jgi:hypothetical protein
VGLRGFCCGQVESRWERHLSGWGRVESLPPHVSGLLAYVSQPSEKANEHLALAYFRKTFGEAFTRQKEAKQADGYIAGSFVLELKGQSKDWLSGLFQGLAYKNLDLDFAQIVGRRKELPCRLVGQQHPRVNST